MVLPVMVTVTCQADARASTLPDELSQDTQAVIH